MVCPCGPGIGPSPGHAGALAHPVYHVREYSERASLMSWRCRTCEGTWRAHDADLSAIVRRLFINARSVTSRKRSCSDDERDAERLHHLRVSTYRVNAASASISPNWIHGSPPSNRGSRLTLSCGSGSRDSRLIARHVATSDTPAAEHTYAHRASTGSQGLGQGRAAPRGPWRIGSRTASFLTFGQLEDLLGCALPDPARVPA